MAALKENSIRLVQCPDPFNPTTHQIKAVECPQVLWIQLDRLRVVALGNLDIVQATHRVPDLCHSLMDQVTVRIVQQNLLQIQVSSDYYQSGATALSNPYLHAKGGLRELVYG